jgi:hypothetical protein
MNEDKYRGIYRIPSARRRDWDYGANAAYYVTICTAHRERFFGEIVADADDDVETQNLASLQIAQSQSQRAATVQTQNFASLQRIINPEY